jgi:radical SAM superfamily enzyme YgiQ (UPF0313 family)
LIFAGGPDLTLNKKEYEGLFDIVFEGEALFEFSKFCQILIKYYDKYSFNEDNFDRLYIKKNEIINEYNNYIEKFKRVNSENYLKKDNNYIKFEKIFPKFERIKVDNYLRKNCLPILLSKGCIANCKFCTERKLYQTPMFFDENDILERLNFYYFRYKKNWFTFYDSMINLYPKKLKDFLLKFYYFQKEKGIKLYWDAQFGIKPIVDDETISLMKETGCVNLFIGLESGSDKILKKMNKLFTTEDALIIFEKLNKYKIHFEISIIIGFPGETENDFNLTLDFLKKNKKLIPKIAQINPFILYDNIKVDFKNEELISDELKEKRYRDFINFIKQNDFLYTGEYLGNLKTH